MGNVQQTEYTIDEMEARYNGITGLYDLSDELLATVESPFVKNQEDQLDLIEPLIAEISDATDILAEEFILIAESRNAASKKANKQRIENSLRKVFAAIADYQERAKATGKTLKNIADPIVAKIQRHVEEIVVVFLEFINISLSAIMQKQQLETVRARDPRIALMMHQHAMSQQ